MRPLYRLVPALTVLLLLFLPAPVQAQPVPFEGEVTAAALQAPGLEVSGPLGFFGVLHPLPGTLLRVEAASADVVVHAQPYRLTPVVGVNAHPEAGTTRTWETHHEEVSARSLRVGGMSFLQAEGSHGPGGDATAQARLVSDDVSARERLHFARDAPSDAAWVPYREGPWPGLEARGSGAPVELRGDVVVTLYDVDLHLRDRSGSTTYETGFVPEDGDRGDDVVEEGEQRRVVATFRDAVVTLEPSGATFLAHLAGAAATGDGRLGLSEARGALRVGSADLAVADGLHLDGAWSALLSPDGARLSASLSGTARSLEVDGTPVDLASVAPEPPLARGWAWATPLLALLVLPPVLVHAVRRRRLDPDVLVAAAGWALDSGRDRGAVAWSRRALRRDAADADAAAIRTVGQYRRGRHAEAVAWLEAWLEAHGDEAGELKVLLELGRLRAGDVGAVARNLRPVLERDPSLLRLLEAGDA